MNNATQKKNHTRQSPSLWQGFVLLLLVCLAAALCACGQQGVAGAAAEPILEETPEPTPPPPLPDVIISELMPSNKATLADATGSFPDWLELYNRSEEPVELGGCLLTAGRKAWTLPALQLEGHGYALIFCSEAGGEGLCAGFNLPAAGSTVSLRSGDGRTIDSLSYPETEKDRSLTRQEDGSLSLCEYPTPGFENSEAGYEAFQNSRATPGLSIQEVCVYDDGELDWVELRNNTDSPIQLGEYWLSDSGSQRLLLQLTEETLEPGGLYGISLGGGSFSLSALRDELYLSRADGTLVDYTTLHHIPYGGTYGRMAGQNGFFYFESPGIYRDRDDGCRFIAAMPEPAEPDGVYNDVQSVEVSLSAPGTIYYTTDGSLPTVYSAVYSGPFQLSATCVIRAISVEPGKLPSPVRDLSYIINENHTLPVTSLVVDPNDMWGSSGIYTNPLEDWEVPASLAFFEEGDSFHQGCSVKIHGATSRINMQKKTYKVKFRGVFGGDLEYDVFHNGVTSFSSLLVRSSQESNFSTQIRDIAMHELAQQCDPSLPTQDYRYTILYINGEYWGIYALREAHSPEHFANHYGYDADQVDMYKEKWELKGEFDAVYQYILYNNMADDAAYEYVTGFLDMDALVTWCIIESFSGNIDINSPNVRFYYSYQDHKLHYALVDLDLGLYEHGLFTQSIVRGYDFSNVPLYLCNNQQFRTLMMEKLSEYLHGPLSEENTMHQIDLLAAEIRDEVPRDAAAFGYTPSQWELELQHYMYDFFDNYGYGNYDLEFVNSAKSILRMSEEDYYRLFGDL